MALSPIGNSDGRGDDVETSSLGPATGDFRRLGAAWHWRLFSPASARLPCGPAGI
jgi:hypothetical protein